MIVWVESSCVIKQERERDKLREQLTSLCKNTSFKKLLGIKQGPHGVLHLAIISETVYNASKTNSECVPSKNACSWVKDPLPDERHGKGSLMETWR